MMNYKSLSCIEKAKPGDLYRYSTFKTTYFVISNTEMKSSFVQNKSWRSVLFIGNNGRPFTHHCLGHRADEYWIPIVEQEKNDV